MPKYTFVIPFQFPWDWSADYQRQTCLELSKKHKVIAYMKKDRRFFLKAILSPIKKYPKYKNIKFYIPYDLIPFQRFDIIRKLNDILSFKIMELLYLDRHKKYLWVFDPLFFPLLEIFNGVTIYDCVDLISIPDKKTEKFVRDCEVKSIKKVDFFFVNSLVLKNRHKDVRTPIEVLPQGFNVDAYKEPKDPVYVFPNNKPLIGFIGAINQRIDFGLVHNLVKRNPKWNFAIWGPKQDNSEADTKITANELNKLLKYKNFITGKCDDRNEVPSIVNQFNIGIIPYDSAQVFNKYCYPMKLFEYFYLAKPVISTQVEELKRFPEFVKIEETVAGWEKQINYYLRHPLSKKLKKEEKNIAIENSWKNKVSRILSAIKYTS